MGCALTSILCGIFDVKHYLHLQVRVPTPPSGSTLSPLLTLKLVPHISHHHQVMMSSVPNSEGQLSLKQYTLLHSIGVSLPTTLHSQARVTCYWPKSSCIA